MGPKCRGFARHVAGGSRSCAGRRHHAATVATALALAFVVPEAATAGSTPDPRQLVAMRDAVARAPVLLVRGDFGLRELRHAWLDSTGVSARRDPAWRPRPALIASAVAPRPEAPPTIPWSEITSLETQRPKKLQGAVAGFVIGLAAGASLAGLHEETYTGDYTRVALILGTPAAGVVAGTLIGSLSGTKVIYRAPTQENP